MRPMNLWQDKRSGRFYVYYERCARFPSGKRVSLKTADPGLAQDTFEVLEKKWHDDRIAELDKGKRISIADASKEYRADPERSDLSESTLRMDELSLRLLGDVITSTRAVRAVTDKDLKKFKSAVLSRGCSPETVKSYLRHIKAFLNWAVDQGYREKMPKIPKVKTERPLPRVLSRAELARLLFCAKKTDREMWRIIIFALWTGCRRTEILKVRWQDVQGNRCRIRGKGSQERTVYLVGGARRMLADRKDLGPVFLQCHKDGYSKRFHAVADAAGVSARFHDLRHTAATRMVESGMPLKAVQKAMGHKDIRTTLRYVQVCDEFVRREMDKLRI